MQESTWQGHRLKSVDTCELLFYKLVDVFMYQLINLKFVSQLCGLAWLNPTFIQVVYGSVAYRVKIEASWLKQYH